ncbi:MAG TPA: amino acid permease C-terminal domain-containing protein, partial [Puia sp.]|nr:amino acid permease C-terminal domain-containing protein [Puia sp.]
KFHTPWFSTIITGIIVAVPSLFMRKDLMEQLTSIGTLFAFVLVSGGVLMLPAITGRGRGFRMPYVSGRYIVPVLYSAFIVLFHQRVADDLQHLTTGGLQEVLFLTFTFLAGVLTLATVVRKYSVIPVLGVLFCAYLLIEIPAIAWEWFFVWMGIGLMVYFAYGYRKSRLTSQSGIQAKPGVRANP